MGLCSCVCVCVRACVRACVCVCVWRGEGWLVAVVALLCFLLESAGKGKGARRQEGDGWTPNSTEKKGRSKEM